MKEREDHVKHLDQDLFGLRATQDSLERTLAMKEKHTHTHSIWLEKTRS